jgi:uncharacterized protein
MAVGVEARAVEAPEFPAPSGYLNDLAGVVDPASADSIEGLAAELKGKTGAELAVVTVKSLRGASIEEVATMLFQEWGIGKKGKDDGVLILLALSERRVRIEVGYGLEGILPDGKTGSIIRLVMGPDLHANRFGPGLLRGSEAVANVIAEDRGVTLGRRGSGVAPEESGGHKVASWLFYLFWFALILFMRIAWYFNPNWRWRSRRRRHWNDPWGGFGGGFGGMGGFGGGGGGGGGGGFGGFGGGRSGGGGASGGF